MKIIKLTQLVAIAVIATTFSMTACKKGADSELTPHEIEDKKSKAFNEDLINRVCAYPYWTPTAITADTPVDIYKKGATTDIFSQRPKHQVDYYISVKRITDRYNNPKVESRLHFGPETLQNIKDKMAKEHFMTPEEIDEELQWRHEASFFLSKGAKKQRQVSWVQPFTEPKYTHSSQTYEITSFQSNELKLYAYDHELKTTIRVTFTGSKTIPQ